MKVLLAPHGTRGDVQPLLALAAGLRHRGHQPAFLAPDDFVSWIREHGFPCQPNGIDVGKTFRSPGADPSAFRWQLRYFRDVLVPALFESFTTINPAVDVIVGSGVQIAAASVAEKWGVAYASAVFCPCVVPNDESPPPAVKTQALPRFLNRFLWDWGVPLAGLAVRGMVNAGRARLGLPSLFNPLSHIARQPTLLAADPDLAPLGDNAPLTVTTTDAWVLDQTSLHVDPRVLRFLDLQPPPIYAGFGSRVTRHTSELADHIIAAARAVGRAVLIASGWASLGSHVDPAEDVLTSGELPHTAVLPRVAAAVHHGGAGTTTAVARAGVPQVVLPQLPDQYYWASRVEALGLGPRPLPVELVTADVLTERLDRALNDREISDDANALGPVIASRNGVPDAVEYLEQLVGQAHSTLNAQRSTLNSRT
jgi:vancomycin aglycone glucosyltransferase